MKTSREKEKTKWSGDIAVVMMEAKEKSSAVSQMLSLFFSPISSCRVRYRKIAMMNIAALTFQVSIIQWLRTEKG